MAIASRSPDAVDSPTDLLFCYYRLQNIGRKRYLERDDDDFKLDRGNHKDEEQYFRIVGDDDDFFELDF